MKDSITKKIGKKIIAKKLRFLPDSSVLFPKMSNDELGKTKMEFLPLSSHDT